MADDSRNAGAEIVVSTETSYRSLPHKDQLFFLLLTRLSEPLFTSSFQSYMFFQLQWFDPAASTAEIATQSGLILSSKTAAHVFTGILWGRLADHRRVGRKKVLIIGLLASSLATLGYGFSKSFKVAITWQILDGALNGTVAMVRCMISELNPEKRHRARALTLLPLFANVGSLVGPLIGGFLTSSKRSSAILSRYPYAAPNICVSGIQALLAFSALCCLSETLEGYGTPKSHTAAECTPMMEDCVEDTPPSPRGRDGSADHSNETTPLLRGASTTSALPFRRMWTPNVISTMLAQFIIAGHLGTFASLWALFLSTPVAPKQKQHLPFAFSGGLGMEPQSVGMALSLLGFAGIILQIMIYPALQDRFGTIKLWRIALCIFPIVYILAPYCALFASPSAEEENHEIIAGNPGPAAWAALLFILVFFVAGRTCVVPATSLLINDCTPHPSVRGTVHTTAVAVSNLSRSIFPTITFLVFARGIEIGVVGIGFWFIAGLAVLSCVASWRVREGTNGK